MWREGPEDRGTEYRRSEDGQPRTSVPPVLRSEVIQDRGPVYPGTLTRVHLCTHHGYTVSTACRYERTKEGALPPSEGPTGPRPNGLGPVGLYH